MVRPGRPMEKGKKLPKAFVIKTDKLPFIFKNIRLKNQTSMKNFAEDLGVSEGCVGYWEKGKSYPKLTDFIDYMNYLGYDVVLKEREVANE